MARLRILAAIHAPKAIRRILDCLGLPTRAPPIAEAEAGADPEPEVALEGDAASDSAWE